MPVCEFHIAAIAPSAIEAGERVRFAAFSKTKAKTTTKTV